MNISCNKNLLKEDDPPREENQKESIDRKINKIENELIEIEKQRMRLETERIEYYLIKSFIPRFETISNETKNIIRLMKKNNNIDKESSNKIYTKLGIIINEHRIFNRNKDKINRVNSVLKKEFLYSRDTRFEEFENKLRSNFRNLDELESKLIAYKKSFEELKSLMKNWNGNPVVKERYEKFRNMAK